MNIVQMALVALRELFETTMSEEFPDLGSIASELENIRLGKFKYSYDNNGLTLCQAVIGGALCLRFQESSRSNTGKDRLTVWLIGVSSLKCSQLTLSLGYNLIGIGVAELGAINCSWSTSDVVASGEPISAFLRLLRLDDYKMLESALKAKEGLDDVRYLKYLLDLWRQRYPESK
ncbi:MAG: hypothetical protein Q7S37_04710 [bacterium]|nr:hypothetical protein [bacterium]